MYQQLYRNLYGLNKEAKNILKSFNEFIDIILLFKSIQSFLRLFFSNIQTLQLYTTSIEV